MSTPDGQALAKYVDQEFAAIASSQVANVVSLPLSPVFAPPSRPRTGTIVYADGVKWNPGAGEGAYVFGSDGNWHFLFDSNPLPEVWNAYTPTLSASIASFTTASASGRYQQFGKTIVCHVTVTIVIAGSGQYPQFTLPVSPLDLTKCTFYGMDRGGVNNMLVMGRSATIPLHGIVLIGPASADPSANGVILEVTSVYEAV